MKEILELLGKHRDGTAIKILSVVSMTGGILVGARWSWEDGGFLEEAVWINEVQHGHSVGKFSIGWTHKIHEEDGVDNCGSSNESSLQDEDLFLNIGQICERLSISLSTFERIRNGGTKCDPPGFPQPTMLGRRPLWRASVLNDWINSTAINL